MQRILINRLISSTKNRLFNNFNHHKLLKFPKWYHGTNTVNNKNTEFITLKWYKDGDDENNVITTPNIPIGISILEAAHENEIDLEGACESSLACSTCHVILQDNIYDKLDEPNDDEYDMLDLAFGLTETSRLGCQIITTKDMDNMLITLPSATRNFYIDGHKPTPH